jgi:hypothetical protein
VWTGAEVGRMVEGFRMTQDGQRANNHPKKCNGLCTSPSGICCSCFYRILSDHHQYTCASSRNLKEEGVEVGHRCGFFLERTETELMIRARGQCSAETELKV